MNDYDKQLQVTILYWRQKVHIKRYRTVFGYQWCNTKGQGSISDFPYLTLANFTSIFKALSTPATYWKQHIEETGNLLLKLNAVERTEIHLISLLKTATSKQRSTCQKNHLNYCFRHVVGVDMALDSDIWATGRASGMFPKVLFWGIWSIIKQYIGNK